MTGAGLVGVPDPSALFGRSERRRGRRRRRVRARGDAADPARDPVARRADRPRDAAARRHRRRPEAARDDRRRALAATRGVSLGAGRRLRERRRRRPHRRARRRPRGRARDRVRGARRPGPRGTAAFGEVGLTGRLRPRRRPSAGSRSARSSASRPRSFRPARAAWHIRVVQADTLRRGDRGRTRCRRSRSSEMTARPRRSASPARRRGRPAQRPEAARRRSPASRPARELRQAIDDIIRSHEGALIVIGDPAELSFLFSGGIRLDQPFTPQLLYELAKMDGAIIVNASATKLVHANVQLMPDPTIPIAGDRHAAPHRRAGREADEGARDLDLAAARDGDGLPGPAALPARPDRRACSRRRTRRVATLDTYAQRLEQVLTRLTALEFQNAVMLDDVLVVLQRAEMTTRMAEEIERDCVELGAEGRLIRMQLAELVAEVPAEKATRRPRLPRRRASSGARGAPGAGRAAVPGSARVRPALTELLGYPRDDEPARPGVAPRGYRVLSHIPRLPDARRQARRRASSRGWRRSSAPPSASSRRSRAWAPSGRGRSARACAASRSTTWSSGTSSCSVWTRLSIRGRSSRGFQKSLETALLRGFPL